MKKYVRLTLCCAAAVMLASGCGKKSDTVEETTTAASETQAEITDKGEVTNLGQYKGVEVTKQDTTVTEADLDQRIASILKANPEVTEITDRPAQKGDTVNIDYVGMKDGEAFDGGTAEAVTRIPGKTGFDSQSPLIHAKKGIMIRHLKAALS